MNAKELLAAIQGRDEAARAEAWMNAGPVGAEGVVPLIGLCADKDTETRRAATRALAKIVRHAGRPGADSEAAGVSKALLEGLATSPPAMTAATICWMLSEIADESAVEPLAKLLADPALREHARAALQRIPGEAPLVAMKKALADAPDDYKPALAESLRRRGAEAPNLPSAKLTPVKQTKVKPSGR